MRTNIIIFLITALLGTNIASIASVAESKTILLNTKNFVYVVFDTNIQDIIYDSDGVEDERSKRKDMIGLRLIANDTAPIGCLVVMEGNRLQHLWLKPGERIEPLVRIQTAAVTAAAAAEAAQVKDTVALPQLASISVKQERDTLFRDDSVETARTNSGTPEAMRAKAKVLLGKAPTIYQLGGEKGKVSVLPQSIDVDAAHLYLTIEVSNTSIRRFCEPLPILLVKQVVVGQIFYGKLQVGYQV